MRWFSVGPDPHVVGGMLPGAMAGPGSIPIRRYWQIPLIGVAASYPVDAPLSAPSP